MPIEFSLADLGIPEPGRKPEDLVGRTLAGCHLERMLGRGGMGAVYAARRPDGARVVVKVMAPEVAANVQLRARFQREWLALSRIEPHPNVVRVFDVREEAQQPVIVMELVEGPSLQGLLQQHGRLSAAQVARLGLDVARGLAAVHAHGMIHRDVKPDNVLVGPDGAAKLVDFGLAKDTFMTTLTRPGQLLGTALYMAPEQWDEEETEDARCDVFALGATLYHLLCGQPPFQGADVHEVADMATSGDYPPPREVVPEVPEAFELVLVTMLEPERRYRYESMAACAADLERVLAGQPPEVTRFELGGSRAWLVREPRYTLGSDFTCQVPVQDPSVAPRHAQLRREDEAWVLRDLKSPSGTRVNGELLSGPRALADGDEVRLGEAPLTFRDPRARAAARGSASGAAAPAVAVDVERRPIDAPALRALVALGDPRSTLHLLEQWAADPFDEAWAERDLTAAFGPAVARAAAGWRTSERARRAAALPGRLALCAGRELGSEPQAWLAWWAQVRSQAPPQLGLPAPARHLRLLVATPGGAQEHAWGDATVVLVGSDPRCHLVLDHPGVARLHATLLRLHGRVMVRDEGRGATRIDGAPARVALLDPGHTLELGEARLRLEAALPGEAALRRPDGSRWIDPVSFEALVATRHPAVARALASALRLAADRERHARSAQALFPSDPAAAQRLREQLEAVLGERARAARQLLPGLVGQDLGPDAAAWERALAAAGPRLGVQLAPVGWPG